MIAPVEHPADVLTLAVRLQTYARKIAKASCVSIGYPSFLDRHIADDSYPLVTPPDVS
jgi:hypothetical protein